MSTLKNRCYRRELYESRIYMYEKELFVLELEQRHKKDEITKYKKLHKILKDQINSLNEAYLRGAYELPYLAYVNEE